GGFACNGQIRRPPRQFQQHSQAGSSDAIGACGCLKTIQKRPPLGGIGAFGAPEMAHIVALVHEFGGCELYRWARGRRETGGHLREPRYQFDRCDQKAKPNSRTDRLAERTDMNDTLITVERRERRCSPACQLQLAQIVVFDHPDLIRGRPREQTKAPLKRQGETKRRLLTGSHDDQLRVRMVAQAMIDIDAFGIDWNGREGQTCELKSLPCEREAWIFDPGRISTQAKHAQRQAEPCAEPPSDDDLRWRAIDAAGDGKIARDFPPQLELAARIGIEGRSTRLGTD